VNPPPIDLVICDLDGTLVDTIPGIAHAVEHTLGALGLAGPGEDALRHQIGGGARRLLTALLGEENADLLDEALVEFSAYYDAHAEWGTVLYPSVQATLDHLRGHVGLAVATAKSRAGTERVLNHFGLLDHFGAVVTMTDMARPKPDPGCVTTILSQLGAAPERTILVGDTLTDVQTAANAGVRSWVVTYGYGFAAIQEQGGYDEVIEDFGRLQHII
jgi:phosphoglycolate phosphatase